MYAIFETGGKQYRASVGDVLKIEKIKEVSSVTFDRVLLVSDGDTVSVGNPILPSAKITADVLSTARGKKILIFKQKPRKNHRKLNGHRQPYTAVKIKEIKM